MLIQIFVAICRSSLDDNELMATRASCPIDVSLCWDIITFIAVSFVNSSQEWHWLTFGILLWDVSWLTFWLFILTEIFELFPPSRITCWSGSHVISRLFHSLLHSPNGGYQGCVRKPQWPFQDLRYNAIYLESSVTHWGRVTHICVGDLTMIGSDNGLSPGRRQAINAGIFLIRPLGTNFSEILIEIHTF